MDDYLRSITAVHGVFLRREAEDVGYHDVQIAKAVRVGHWVRVRHGAYTFGDTWSQLDDVRRYQLRCRAAYRTAKTEVVLSHAAALPFLDVPMWGIDRSVVHLTRRDGRTGRNEAGVHQHAGRFVDGDIVEIDGLPVCGPTRAALEVTTMTSIEPGLCVVDHVLNRGLTTPEQLASRYAAMTQWPHTLRTQLVLRLADARAGSIAETRSRYLFRRMGLPAPQLQFEVRDADGMVVALLDFAWPEYGLFVEFDGAIKYGRLLKPGESASDVVIAEKRREDLVRELTGWRCIRLSWDDLAHPERTAARIRAAMTGGAVA